MTATQTRPADEGAPQLASRFDHARPDGSLDVDGFVLPFSAYASAEARQDMTDKFRRLKEIGAASATQAPGDGHPVHAFRGLTDRLLFEPLLQAQRGRYPVTMTEDVIGGLQVQVFLPEDGTTDEMADRVLIDLHGGGFMMGWPLVSQIESIPMSAVGGIEVISINYGKFPEAVFPAASRDVAAVYRALLKTHDPAQIGIYGGSAGGILASQAISWFQQEGLPLPAGIALWSAGTGPEFTGDSVHVTPQLGSYVEAPTDEGLTMPYFAGADVHHPLVDPAASPEVLAAFPPSLFVTGTRAADMSGVSRSHLDLVRAGVDARLLLWDGLDHTFMYNPEMPESRDAYALTVDFFRTVMGRAAAGGA